MAAFSDISDKIIAILEKTKEAILVDIKSEFFSEYPFQGSDGQVTIKGAVDLMTQVDDQLAKLDAVVDAVFIKLGIDFTHPESECINNLKTKLSDCLQCIDNLSGSFKELTSISKDASNDEKADALARFIEKFMPALQDLLNLIRKISDEEAEATEKYCEDAWKEFEAVGQSLGTAFKSFDYKALIRRIVDYVLMTMLKNARDVFADEIQFIELQARLGKEAVEKLIDNVDKEIQNVQSTIKETAGNIKEEVEDWYSNIETTVESLESDLQTEFGEVASRLSSQYNKTGSELSKELKKLLESDAIITATRVMTTTYGILEFLGIISEKKIELKLPDAAIQVLTKTKDAIESGLNEVAGAANTVSGQIGSAVTTLDSVSDLVSSKLEEGLDNVKGVAKDTLNNASSLLNTASTKLHISQASTYTAALQLATMQVDGAGEGLSKDLKDAYAEIRKGVSQVSGDAQKVAETINDKITDLNGSIDKALAKVTGFSYSVSVPVILWEKIENLFTHPIKHFKQIYPIESMDDAKQLMEKFMSILHSINPDIPDFASLISMLETLLKNVKAKVMELVKEVTEKAKEKANEFKRKIVNLFKPFIEKIENLIKLLKQVANQLKDKAEYVVKYVKSSLDCLGNELKDAVEAYYQQLSQVFDSTQKELSSIADKAQKKVDSAVKSLTDSANDAKNIINKVADNIETQVKKGEDAVTDALNQGLHQAESEAGSFGNKLLNALTDVKIEVPTLSGFSIKNDVLIPAFADSINIDWDQYSVDSTEVTAAAGSVAGNSEQLVKDLCGVISDTYNKELDTLVGDCKKELQTWATSVATSIKTVTDPDIWKDRLDNVLTALQAEMQTDMRSVTSLVSADGVKNLVTNFSSTTSSIARELDINSYVNILRTAVGDVILPNPELYYQSFKEVVLKIIDKIKNFFSQFIEKLEAELTTGANKIVDSLSELKGQAKELWDDLVAKIKQFIDDVADKDKLLEIVNKLLLSLWKRIKEQLIMPIINALKNTVISVVRKVIRVIIEEIIDTILEKIAETAKDENVKKFISNLKEAKKVVSQFEAQGLELYETGKVIVKEINEDVLGGMETAAKEVATAAWKSLDKDIKNQIGDTVQSVSKDIQTVLNEGSSALQEVNDKTQEILNSQYIQWTRELLLCTSAYLTSEMKLKDTIALVVAIVRSIPEEVRENIEDLLPSIPDNDFFRYCRSLDYECDLDNLFLNATLFDLGKLIQKDESTAARNNSSTKFNASLLIQTTIKVSEYSFKENADDEEEQTVPAILFTLAVKGALGLSFYIGDNHSLALGMEGAISEVTTAKTETEQKNDAEQQTPNDSAQEQPTDDTEQAEQKTDSVALGFYLTKKVQGRYLHGKYDTAGMNALFYILFKRENKAKDGKTEVQPAKWIDSKYIELSVKNYPQIFYIGYNPDLKGSKELNAVLCNRLDNIESRTGFQVGYLAAIEGLKLLLKLRENKLLGQLLKDDISVDLDTYIGYDLQQGLLIGGKPRLHIDFDVNNLKLGNLTLNNLGLDLGSSKYDFGSLGLNLDSTFQIDFSALVMSFEGLGIGFDLSFLKSDGSVGDWDFGCNFKWPSGIGINIDCPAIKGTGLISLDLEKGECMGVLSLSVIDKFGVSAFLLMDTGELEGHSFSLVAMISAQFSPGIPLGMGFSLSAIGGCLGLNRCIDREGLIKGTRQGTLGSVFFVKDVKNHLSEMKESATQFFPAKKNQFFVGLLGQIRFEPIVSCDFGLVLQVPNPVEIIIIGALKVSVGEEADDLVRINVYFAGGINFEEGIWFDASIVDSKIVGISLAGDMAFRLFWGGKTKGFLLSIGGFHPDYHPEAGMQVSGMKRLSMGLNYSILKINLATYLAVTSNSFQIGAQLDLKIGWKKFGISGYAGFDALFQWDPFLFAFNLRAGVAVVCGSWKLLSIDLSLDVKGPKPWYVKGSAKFWFIFIPIKVGFEISWGDNTPELPSAEVKIKELLDEVFDNPLNWTRNSNVSDSSVIIISETSQESSQLVLTPYDTLVFNQSRIPLKTEISNDNEDLAQFDVAELLKMDLCDNARPVDYSIIEISSVDIGDNGEHEMTAANGNLAMQLNDFAPSLYVNMNLQEKLQSKSYVQYNSGFEVVGGEDAERAEAVEVEIKVEHFLAKALQEEPASASGTAVVTPKTRSIKAEEAKAAEDSVSFASAKEGISAIIGGLMQHKQGRNSNAETGLAAILAGLKEYHTPQPVATSQMEVRASQPARRDKASFNSYVKSLEKRRLATLHK